jgi:hypothetical protein
VGGTGQRVRRRRRHDVPDQAGRHRGPAGRCRRAGDRPARRGRRRSAPVPRGPARRAADGQPVEIPSVAPSAATRPTTPPQASDDVLWWPPTKVAAPFLSPYLEQLDKGGASGSQGRAVRRRGGPGR